MSKTRKEVKNLVLMLGSGVVLAALVVFALVYCFGQSGTFLLRDVLVSPQALEGVELQNERFVYNKIEFERADPSGQGWGRYAVSQQSYAAFYDEVEHVRSVLQVTDEMTGQFRLVAPSTLTIFVQPSLFQQVEFIENADLFRVKKGDMWIYFRYPGVNKLAIELFAPEG